MGRLPVVMLGVIVAACNDPTKPTQGGRSEQVAASGSAVASASAAPTATEHATPRGPLCDTSAHTGQERAMPKTSLAFVDSTGAVSDRAMPAWDGKHARWVSFFASWCGPCKEEIPRIQRFAKKLEGDGVLMDVTYLSIDDDLRQLVAFFGQQPEGGVKSSYWLKDGPPRTAWLASLKMKSEPPLPEHAIFDGKGKLRCFVSGAIEEGDYAQLLASLR
jgi:thiol-disulfide isomerase/thioredoxin